MANPPDPFKPWYEYSDMAHKWRGEVINHAIDLEQVMEIFIARHYTIGISDEDYDQKLEEFKKTFFWDIGMSFGHKMTIIKGLIELYQPLLHKMYPEVNVYTELDDIIKTRNAMAHWQLDFSKEYRWEGAKNRVMKVNKLKAGVMTIYSEENIKRIVDLCRKYTTIFLHWSEYPIQNALPTIFYATEKRMKNLSEAERTLIKKSL